MAIVLPSVLRSKYAVLAALGLVTVGLGTYGSLRWGDSPFGLFGDNGGADRIATSGAGQAGQGEGLTGIDAVDDAIAALLGRSPGERTVGISEKGKGPARAYRYARSPAAQALEEAFSSPVGASRVIEDRSPAATLPPGLFLPDFPATEPVPGLFDAALPSGVTGGPGGGAFFPPGGFSVGGGGGGGGIPGNPDNPGNPGNPPPVVPAIPEPSTWLMLLLGMAAVGAAMRSGKPSLGGDRPVLS